MPLLLAPEFGVTAAALIALGITFGLYLLAQVVAGPFRHVPFVGGAIANGIESLMRGALHVAHTAFEATFHAPAQLFKIARTMFGKMHEGFSNTISDVLGYAHRIELWVADSALPRVYAYFTGWIRSVYASAVHFYHLAQADITRVEAWAGAQISATVHWAETYFGAWIRSVYASAVHFYHLALAEVTRVEVSIGARIDSLTSWVTAEVAAARAAAFAYALGLFRTAEADLARGLAVAEADAAAFAAQARAGAITAIDGAASAGLAAVWPGIITDVDQLRGVIADSWPDIRDAVDAIPRAVPTDLADAMAAAGALAIPALRFLEDCGLPNCRNLGGLGNLLHLLEGAVGDGLLFALLAEMAANPQAAEADITAVFRPLIDGARDIVHAAAGLLWPAGKIS